MSFFQGTGFENEIGQQRLSLIICSQLTTITKMTKVVHYVSEDGTDPFDIWFVNLSSEARARVQTRIDRVELGNFGDYRSVGHGVCELRIDFGPGYRVYYGRDGEKLVILLGGGTKKRQSNDIVRAQTYWKAYKQEKRDAH